MAPPKNVLIKTYRGNQAAASRAFEKDAAKLAAQGYYPTSQTWAPGSHSALAFLGALLLCFLLIGIVIFLYMLLVKPAGTLTVTYQLRESAVATPAAALASDEKTCPQCAEQVKAAAKVCRFCGHSFAAA